MTTRDERNEVAGATSSRAAIRAATVESIVDGLPEAIVLYDTQGRITFANADFCRRVRRTNEELIGFRPFEWDDGTYSEPDDVARFREHLDTTIATGRPLGLVRQNRQPSGEVLSYQVSFSPLTDEDGRIVGAVMLGQDISDLTTAQRGLAEREREFRTLAENLPEILVRYDRDGRAVYANRQFELHVAGPSLVGRIPEDQPSRSQPYGLYRETLRAVLATGQPGRAELITTGPDGGQRFQSVRIQPEFDAEGNVTGAITLGHDVTDLVRARQEAAAREREFRTLAEHLPDLVRRYDRDLRATYANHVAAASGVSGPDDVIGRMPSEVRAQSIGDVEPYERTLREVVERGVPGSVTLSFHDGAGDEHTYHVVMHPERDDQGQIVGAVAIGRDITDLLRAERVIAESERKFRSLAENAVDHIARWDVDGTRTYVNPSMARHLGAAPNTFATLHDGVRAVIADQLPRTVEQRSPLSDGTDSVWEVRLVPEFDDEGGLISVLGIGRDITAVVHQRDVLELAARTDALTGIASRQVLYERVPTMIDQLGDGQRLAMLLIDLDGFKHINDQYGHRLGDRILREAACRFTTCMGPDDILVRIGGDEFVVVLGATEDAMDASVMAHQLRLHLAELSRAEENLPLLDASVGIAIAPHDGGDVDALLAHADLALYEAKRTGRGRAEFYRPELRAAMERRSAIEQALRDSCPDAEMSLHLQPICSIGDAPTVWGAEALLRWHHPQLGFIPPDEFIRIAEQSGQIVPIGRWVLRRAAEIAVALNASRVEPLRIAVNVSTRQFTLDDIGDAVRDAVLVTGCDPRWLVLEITESLLLEDSPMVRRSLDALRALGVAIAIDDFGTGYSALHYLTRLRVDHMKIDKSFVRDADVDHQQQEIVRALMAMAAALGIEVVAEGIETQGQAALLDQLGCRLGQGYLLARPMPADQFDAWLRTAHASLRECLPA